MTEKKGKLLVLYPHQGEMVWGVPAGDLYQCLFFLYRLYDAEVPVSVVESCAFVARCWKFDSFCVDDPAQLDSCPNYRSHVSSIGVDIWELDEDIDTWLPCSREWRLLKECWTMLYEAANAGNEDLIEC